MSDDYARVEDAIPALERLVRGERASLDAKALHDSNPQTRARQWLEKAEHALDLLKYCFGES